MPVRSQRRVAYRHLNQYVPLSPNQPAPWPELTGLDPNSAAVGDPDVTLRCYGTGFAEGAVVVFDDGDVPTTFVSEGEVTAVISPSTATEGSVLVCVRNLDDRETEDWSFDFTAPAVATLPPLTAINPATLPAGSMDWSMGVTGTGFVDGDTVYADDTALATSFFGDTYLNSLMTASLMATPKTIAITQRRGAETSPPLTFTVGPPLPVPAITSTSPASVVAGSPNTPLTVTGTGFDDQCQIRLNGSGKSTTFVSSTQLTGMIAASLMTAPGTIAVVVNNPNAGVSNQADIPVTAAAAAVPILDYISPTSSKLNPLLDMALYCYCDASLTYHADMWVMVDDKRYEYVSWSQQLLEISIPKVDLAVSGIRQVRVVDAAGESLPQPFTVEAAPALTLTSYSPNPIAASFAGGVTVIGTGFDATTEFYLDGGGFDPSWVVINTSTRATITAPSEWTAGGHVLTAYSDSLGQNSNELPIMVAAAVPDTPVITSLSPDKCTVGAAPTVSVVGTGFVDGAKVTVNASHQTTTFVSATELTFDLGAGWTINPTVLAIAATNDQVTYSTTVAFNVEAAAPAIPTLTALTPNSAMVGDPDTIIGVSGTGFGGTAGAVVMLNGETPMATTYYSPTQLSFLMPANWMNNPATFQMSVVTAGGTSNSTPLTVAAPAPTAPVITSLAPNSLPVGSPQTTVVVTGTGFVAGSVVVAGGANMVTTYVSATQLSCIVPPAYFTVDGSLAFYVDNLDSTTSNVLYLTIRAARKTTRKKRK